MKKSILILSCILLAFSCSKEEHVSQSESKESSEGLQMVPNNGGGSVTYLYAWCSDIPSDTHCEDEGDDCKVEVTTPCEIKSPLHEEIDLLLDKVNQKTKIINLFTDGRYDNKITDYKLNLLKNSERLKVVKSTHSTTCSFTYGIFNEVNTLIYAFSFRSDI